MTKYERLREALESTGTGQMKAFGTSMLPIIKSGALLTYEKQDSYQAGRHRRMQGPRPVD
jgi:hypothetical protein